MGKASFNKHQRREQRASRCFHCEAFAVSQTALDEELAKRGVRLEADAVSTMSIPCVLCGETRNFRCYGLTLEMQREFMNLRRMIDRDTRLRGKCSDEVMRLWVEFSQRYVARCVLLYGLVYAEALQAADAQLEEWFTQHAEEVMAGFEHTQEN